MATYFKNKFRNESTRLQNWDYRWKGAYFITICTKNKEHYFGEIRNGKMNLSNIGILADIFWHEIKNHSENVKLGAFVVMPNHVHAILILDPPFQYDNGLSSVDNVGTGDVVGIGHGAGIGHGVGIGHALSLQTQPNTISQPNNDEKTIGQKRFQNIGNNSVSSIIGSYKSAVTKHARRLGYTFEWQRLYHDHLIRNEQSFQNISNYIHNNVQKWEEDRFNIN